MNIFVSSAIQFSDEPPRLHDVWMLVAFPVGEAFKLAAHPCRLVDDRALSRAQVDEIDVGGHGGCLQFDAVSFGSACATIATAVNNKSLSRSSTSS